MGVVVQGMNIKIVLLEGDKLIQEADFDKFPITIGRHTDSNFYISGYNYLSRSHAVIEVDKEKVLLKRDNAKTPFIVNSKKKDEVVVTSGDIITLAKSLKIQIIILKDDVTITEMMGEAATVDPDATVIDDSPVVPSPVRQNSVSSSPIHAVSKKVEKKSSSFVSSTNKEMGYLKEYNVLDSLSSHPVLMDNKVLEDSYHVREEHKKRKKALECSLVWNGKLIEVKQYHESEVLILGPEDKGNFEVPTFESTIQIATVKNDEVFCYIPDYFKVQLVKNRENIDLATYEHFSHLNGKYTFSLDESMVLKVDLGYGVEVFLKEIPETKAFSDSGLVNSDFAFQQTIVSSGIFHTIILMLAVLLAPPSVEPPKLPGVPKRVAKILVKAPVKKVKPKPKPKAKKKIEKKIVKKAKPKKKITRRRPKRVVVKKNVKMKKLNKFPVKLKNRRVGNTNSKKHQSKKVKTAVAVNKLGAIGALGAISKNTNPVKVAAININKNAGGMKSNKMSTSSMVSTLKSANGKLPPAGGVGVKTRGKGYGTGTGYGVQGLKGTAGSRTVAGAVVGTPKIFQVPPSGGLSRKQVMAVVKKHLSKIQRCYEKALLVNPDIAGRAEFEWLILPNGRVQRAKVKKSSVANGTVLHNCVVKVIKRMKFPVAKNGMATTPNIGFPFGRL